VQSSRGREWWVAGDAQRQFEGGIALTDGAHASKDHGYAQRDPVFDEPAIGRRIAHEPLDAPLVEIKLCIELQ
jgi:hypothetical protein